LSECEVVRWPETGGTSNLTKWCSWVHIW
jgi:hypothetical protein